ncbi:MAG: hypothetical protein ACLQPD_02230 [Desulfomonilaceae bacterium]
MILKTSHYVWRFSVKILALLMVVGPLCGPAWSQKATPQTTPQTGSQSVQSVPASIPGPMQLNWYRAARYSIFGPTPLNSVDSKSLGFTGGYGLPGVTISLANKNVSVMTETGASVPFSALAPGVRVVVCDRSGSVIFVVRSPEADYATR